MRRPVCWTEREDDGVKREVRVNFLGGGRIKWQFKRADTAAWDYDSAPRPADWAALEARVAGRCQRGAPLRDLELVRSLRPADDAT